MWSTTGGPAGDAKHSPTTVDLKQATIGHRTNLVQFIELNGTSCI